MSIMGVTCNLLHSFPLVPQRGGFMARKLLRKGINRVAVAVGRSPQPDLPGGMWAGRTRRGRPAFRPGVEALEARLTPTVSFAAQQTFAAGGNNPFAVVVADF